MYSSRKSSVKRHIQNIHSGNANLVSFVDYVAGRKSGFYLPALPPTYQKKNNETNNKKVDYLNIMSEEVWRQWIRQKIGTPNLSNIVLEILSSAMTVLDIDISITVFLRP
jgi:hypothetical protein